MAALSSYRPAPLAVPVWHFSSYYDGEAWRRISSDLEVIRVPGEHEAVRKDPTSFADHLRRRLVR